VKNDYKSELVKKLEVCPLFKHYLGPSLQQRIDTSNWFENRFILAILRETGWMEKHEKLFTEAEITKVENSDEIFAQLDCNDSDYDWKIFDLLAEVRLVRWARQNGYTAIEKIIPSIPQTPDFIMRKDAEIVLVEAKHLRERDFLPEFVRDRIKGLALITGYLTDLGIIVDTTDKYDNERTNLLEKHQQGIYRELVREELTEEWLETLVTNLKDNSEGEHKIINGLFVISLSKAPSDVGVAWGPPVDGAILMLEKLRGNLFTALEQINSFISHNSPGEIATKALVFFSGTGPWNIEWDYMWRALEESDEETWQTVEEIYNEASQLADIPFELIVGKGNPLKYEPFLWKRNG